MSDEPKIHPMLLSEEVRLTSARQRASWHRTRQSRREGALVRAQEVLDLAAASGYFECSRSERLAVAERLLGREFDDVEVSFRSGRPEARLMELP